MFITFIVGFLIFGATIEAIGIGKHEPYLELPLGCYFFSGLINCTTGPLTSKLEIQLWEHDSFTSDDQITGLADFRTSINMFGLFFSFKGCCDDDSWFDYHAEFYFQIKNVCKDGDWHSVKPSGETTIIDHNTEIIVSAKFKNA